MKLRNIRLLVAGSVNTMSGRLRIHPRAAAVAAAGTRIDRRAAGLFSALASAQWHTDCKHPASRRILVKVILRGLKAGYHGPVSQSLR
jgi:hypothetical protein